MRPAVVALVLGIAGSAVLGGKALAAEEAPKSAPTVVLAAVALPIVIDGKLINYVFCTVRLDLAPEANSGPVRAKEQLFRDDLVRVGHRTPFTRPDDYNRVDELRVRTEIARFAPSVLGPGVLRSSAVIKQVPMKTLSPPSVPRPSAKNIVP